MLCGRLTEAPYRACNNDHSLMGMASRANQESMFIGPTWTPYRKLYIR